jgi:YD repeat-containing protein
VGIYLMQRHALPGVSVPASPANLAVVANTPTQVTVTWSAAASGVGVVYTLERQLEDGAFVAIAEVMDQLTYTDTTILAGRPYSYRIKARTYAGSSGTSASVVLLVPGDSDGDGTPDADEVTAGTNPVDRYNGRGFTLVTTSGPGAVFYTYDLSGRITGAAVGEHATLAFGFDAASNLTSATSTIVNPTAIQTWRSGHGLPADGSGDGADRVILAGDGLPNLAKYAFGLVPQTTVTASHPSIALVTVSSAQHLALTYQRPDPAPPDIAYVVEVSSDGVTWSSGSGATVETGTVVNSGRADVTVRDATAVASPAFGRRIRLSIQREAQP